MLASTCVTRTSSAQRCYSDRRRRHRRRWRSSAGAVARPRWPPTAHKTHFWVRPPSPRPVAHGGNGPDDRGGPGSRGPGVKSASGALRTYGKRRNRRIHTKNKRRRSVRSKGMQPLRAEVRRFPFWVHRRSGRGAFALHDRATLGGRACRRALLSVLIFGAVGLLGGVLPGIAQALDPSSDTSSSSTTTTDTTGSTEPAPSDPVPSDPVPSDPAPSDPVPTDPAPSDPVPSDPAPSDPAPSDSVPSDPVPSDPAPSDPAPSDPAPSDPAPSDPAPSDPGRAAPGAAEPTPTDPVPTGATDATDTNDTTGSTDTTDTTGSIDPCIPIIGAIDSNVSARRTNNNDPTGPLRA